MKTSVSKRRRIRTGRNPRRYRLAGLIAAAALFAAAVMVAMSGGREKLAPGLADGLASPVIFDGFPTLPGLDASPASSRPVYRHSVIPGGAYTPEEFKVALMRDEVVAAHYSQIKPDAVRADVVTQDRFAYVSYRKDNQVYWTRNKVRLSAGETILTDGAHEIRGRCGNCISDTARFPVAETEPDPAELDRLVDDSEQPGDPFLAAAIRSALNSPGSAASGMGGPGANAGGPGGGSPSSNSNSTGVGPGTFSGGGPGGGVGPTRFAGSPGSPGGSQGAPFGGPEGPGGDNGQPGAPPSAFGGPGLGDTPGAYPPAGGGPSSGGGPSLGDPTAGGLFPDGPNSPPGTPWIPPGIDLPPGFDPEGNPPTGSNPPPGGDPATPGSEPGPTGPDPNTREPGSPQEPASVPEPGTVLLVGGGVAAALLRRLRRRS